MPLTCMPPAFHERNVWRAASDALAEVCTGYRLSQWHADSWPAGHRLRHKHEEAALRLFPQLIECEKREKEAYRTYMAALESLREVTP